MADFKIPKRRRRRISFIPFLITLLILVAAFSILTLLDIAGIIELPWNRNRETYIVTEGTVEIHMIDVGQGDSILIMAPAGNILVDTGDNDAESENKLKAYLDGLGIETIDYMIITHYDADHIGGADMILETYTVETVIIEEYYYGKETGVYKDYYDALAKSKDTVTKDPNVGEEMTVGELHLKFLGPTERFDEKNNDSIVVRFDFGENSIMMTGDAETEAERALVETYSVSELDCDVLKVGHHGAKTSTIKDFLKAVSPEYALISCGEGNSYGHPKNEILDRLEDEGSKIHRTDKTGNIVLVFDGKDITVKDE
jgi:DNA internalization-related competence protein ComEC/Rec2